MITEQLMAAGDWQLRFRSVPRSISRPDRLFFSHLIITPARVPAALLDESPNYGSGKLLALVVGNSGSLTSGDTALQSLLSSIGHTVTVIDDGATEVTKASSSGYKAVVVAPSATGVGVKYRGRGANALPVLHMAYSQWGSTTGDFFTPGSAGASTGGHINVNYRSGGDGDFAWPGQTPPSSVVFGTTYSLTQAWMPTSESLHTGGLWIASANDDTNGEHLWSYAVGDAAGSGAGTMTARVVGAGLGDNYLAAGLNTNGEQWIKAALDWLDPSVAGSDPTTLLNVAAYTGVVRDVRRNGTDLMLSGPGLAMWLGTEDGVGVEQSLPGPGTKDFANWVGYLRPSSLVAGTVTATGSGTYTAPFAYVTRRQALATICDHFGGEWRITPAGALDAGSRTDLYGTDPTALAVADQSGIEPDLYTLGAPTIDLEWSADDYVTTVWARGNGVTGSYGIGALSPYRDLFGGALQMADSIDASAVTVLSEANALAQAEFERTGIWRAITIKADDHIPTVNAPVGSDILVYAPDVDCEDTTNPHTYGGRTIFPVRARLLRASWPVKAGCGVYLRSGYGVYSGSVIDLTDYLIAETGNADLEVDTVRWSPSITSDTRARK